MHFVVKAVTGGLVLVAVLAVVGCGASTTKRATHTATTPLGLNTRTVDIYSSLPLQGPMAAQGHAIVNGIELALAQASGRAGSWTVNYTSLDDATAGQKDWDADKTGSNARQVAEDPKAVYYVGEFSSVASELSIPILNQAKVPQVSPANTYASLTTTPPGSTGPTNPSGVRTYLRLVPNDSVQAAADLMALKGAGCRKVAVASFGDSYGTEVTALLAAAKDSYGVTLASNSTLDPSAGSFNTYATGLRSQGVDCFFLAASASPSAVILAEDIHATLPKAKLFGPDELCVSAFTNARLGGVPPSVDRLIECTLPVLSLSSYPGGRQFEAAYKAKYGDPNPSPYAIYGYEAMKLGLETIAGLGSQGNNKLAVLRALFAVRHRDSVLGTYGFESTGDTTLRSYGLYKVGPTGEPQFFKTLTPPVS
jgi:branched-chain amino acid transport system substrate-binding protein